MPIFDNTEAIALLAGHDIIQRDEKGRITRRTRITTVNRSAHMNHVHVTTKGGSVWCYDVNARVEMD